MGSLARAGSAVMVNGPKPSLFSAQTLNSSRRLGMVNSVVGIRQSINRYSVDLNQPEIGSETETNHHQLTWYSQPFMPLLPVADNHGATGVRNTVTILGFDPEQIESSSACFNSPSTMTEMVGTLDPELIRPVLFQALHSHGHAGANVFIVENKGWLVLPLLLNEVANDWAAAIITRSESKEQRVYRFWNSPCGSTALMGPSSTGGPRPNLFLAMTRNMYSCPSMMPTHSHLDEAVSTGCLHVCILMSLLSTMKPIRSLPPSSSGSSQFRKIILRVTTTGFRSVTVRISTRSLSGLESSMVHSMDGVPDKHGLCETWCSLSSGVAGDDPDLVFGALTDSKHSEGPGFPQALCGPGPVLRTNHGLKRTTETTRTVYLRMGAWAVLGSEGRLNFPGPAWFSAATLKMYVIPSMRPSTFSSVSATISLRTGGEGSIKKGFLAMSGLDTQCGPAPNLFSATTLNRYSFFSMSLGTRISLPPSSRGASHLHTTEFFLTSSNRKFTEGPGVSAEIEENQGINGLSGLLRSASGRITWLFQYQVISGYGDPEMLAFRQISPPRFTLRPDCRLPLRNTFGSDDGVAQLDELSAPDLVDRLNPEVILGEGTALKGMGM
ncbi:hypothetical protein F7725_002638 [Dissostichus mawsoni]|uniref:Uncharacterized protein n=1 Tax=Dissostichus mawsoni TaxID=36200 RepID=A0A7J5Y4Q8_DISMA|nr:hypothetical protein F7725_002638 [Dissostichus mawsoni]